MLVTTDDGIQLYVERRGKGLPCLYLHGGPGYWSKSFSDLAGPLLESHFEMIYVDQRGCGRSSHQSQDYSLKRLTEDIEEVRKHLEIDKFYLLAHSFGGILAVHYAKNFSEHILGILLMNVTLNMKDSLNHQYSKGLEMLHAESPATGDMDNMMKEYESVQLQLLEKNMFFSLQFKDVKNKIHIDEIDIDFISDPELQKYIFSSSEYFQNFTLITEEIKQPVLILAGKHDHAVGPEHHQDFRFPNALVRILDTGHHPYVENPLDYQEAVIDFLNNHLK